MAAADSVLKEFENLEGFPCRSVTEEEVAHFTEEGWVKLKQFIHPKMIEVLHQRAIELMGEDGESNEDFGIRQPYFNPFPCDGLNTPPIDQLIYGLGRGAKALMNRKAGIGTRYFFDTLIPKLPAGKVSSKAGNGPTSFHQDYITFAVDRTGGMQFWIPLEACGPEKGTMSFISKSHRMGVMGNYTSYNGKDIREVWPELNELETSDAMTYELGDITVHDHLTVHGAGANMTDTPRWAYIMSTQPSDAHWNGAPPQAFDPAHLQPYELLDEERFPTLVADD